MSILNDIKDDVKDLFCKDSDPATDRHEAIAKIAHGLWEHRGGHSTHEQQKADWHKAEKIYDSGFGQLDAPAE